MIEGMFCIVWFCFLQGGGEFALTCISLRVQFQRPVLTLFFLFIKKINKVFNTQLEFLKPCT